MASGNTLKISPGDCLTVYPKNYPADAQRIIELMRWQDQADLPLNLSASPELPRGLYAEDGCTLRDLLTHNLDITSIPRRSFLKNLSYFASDPDHKQRLLEFTRAEYTDEFYDYTTRPRRTILEVLEEFTSVRIPVDRVLDTFPVIRGRDFSIANGGPLTESPDGGGGKCTTRIELLVALVKYRTVLRKPREGVCSRYLAPLEPGTRLRLTHKPSVTKLSGPVHARRPLVAIGTGTGIAPIRALIQERISHQTRAQSQARGKNYLFFGNRNRDADYFFRDEWESLGSSLQVFTAFSRDQREKVYVQDLIRREAELVARLISEDAIFLVCGGSSKMAEACKLAFLHAMRVGGLVETEDEAHELFGKLTWWQEIW
jgi:sulfite reductase alpha subunit-like flavoprotein